MTIVFLNVIICSEILNEIYYIYWYNTQIMLLSSYELYPERSEKMLQTISINLSDSQKHKRKRLSDLIDSQTGRKSFSEKAGISMGRLSVLLNGKGEFRADEIKITVELLSLKGSEINLYFFGQ